MTSTLPDWYLIVERRWDVELMLVIYLFDNQHHTSYALYYHLPVWKWTSTELRGMGVAKRFCWVEFGGHVENDDNAGRDDEDDTDGEVLGEDDDDKCWVWMTSTELSSER